MEKKQYTDPWLLTVDEDKEKTFPLRNSTDLDPLLERIGDAHCVLLGEATHGTHEYYTWRTAITKRLIDEKGFESEHGRRHSRHSRVFQSLMELTDGLPGK